MAPAASRTRAAGRVAVAGVACLWLLAGAAFVAPRGPVEGRGLRGSAHELEVRTFESQDMGAEEAPQMSWNSVISAAAAFGMVAAMATAPARAEEAAAPAAAPAPVDKMAQFKAEADKVDSAKSGALSKEERNAAALAKAKNIQLDGEFASKSAETPKTTNKGAARIIKRESKAKAEQASGADSKGTATATFTSTGRSFVSPADELDEDELSLSRSNPVALFLLATFAPGIYLVFYVLGSLDII